MIMNAAMKSGFTGGLVIDFPNSKKAKKFYLCLFAGQSAPQDLPKALGEEGEEATGVTYANKRVIERRKSKGSRRPVKDKNWVLYKKELSRTRGKENVPLDSKYTARKRKPRF
ncbi:18S rRNA (guanine1575-N7)-methyltransferase [Basidiobolus ranarum]